VKAYPLVAWAMTGDAVARAAVLVTTVIAARFATTSQFGIYIALAAVYVVAGAVWDGGGSTLLTREYARGTVTLRSGLRQIARMRIALLPLWAVAFGVGTASVASSATSFEVALFAAASLLFSAYAPILAVLRARLQFRAAAASVAVGRWTTALAAILLINPQGMRPLQALGLATVFGELTTVLISSMLLVRASRRAAERPESRPGALIRIRSALPLAMNGLLSLVYNRFDVLLLPVLATTTQLAAYAPASRVQDALYLIPFGLGAVALPLMSRPDLTEREIGHILKRLVMGGFAVAVPVAAVVAMWTPTLLRVVLGPNYQVAASPTRILVWFLPMAVVQAPILAGLVAVGRARDTTIVYLATFGVALSMHVVLDPRFGALGGAVATLSRDVAALPIAIWLGYRAGIIRKPGAALLRSALPEAGTGAP
jgi:O-antigen/teichoic acid export membrane protein